MSLFSRHEGPDVRLGVIEAGRVVMERKFSPRETVRLGQEARCQVLVESSPGSHALLRFVRGSWCLQPPPGVETLVARGDGAPEAIAAPVSIGLGDKARLRVGAVTVLIQPIPRVAEPAFSPRFFEQDDLPFLVSLQGAAVLGVALIAWTLTTPIRADFQIDKGQEALMARIVMPPRLPEPAPLRMPVAEPAPGQQPNRVEEPARQTVRDAARELAEDPLLAAIALLGSHAGRTDVFAKDDLAGEQLRVALDKVDGTYQVNEGNPDFRSGHRTGDRDIGSLDHAEVGMTTVNEGPDVTVDRDRLLSVPPTVTGGLEAETRKLVRAGTGGLVACYERALDRDPGLSGRVELAWEVRAGRVVRVRVEDNETGDDELGRCMTERVRGWSYGTESAGEVIYPFVLSPKS